MRRSVLLLLCVLTFSGPGCIWKLWNKGEAKPQEAREFDLYGNVVSVNAQELVVDAKGGRQTFVMDQASVKGGDFQPGARVHVFYKMKEAGQTVVLVVEVRN